MREDDFLITFHFQDGDSKRSVDYQVVPANPPFEKKLLVYCLHTVRSLINTAHSIHGKRLAALLIDKDQLRSTFIDDPYYKLVPYDGTQSKMRVITKAVLANGFTPIYTMKIRGFGFFGDRPVLGCIRSLGMHFHFLFDQYQEDVNNIELLFRASEFCVGVLSIDNKIRNQAKYASSVMDEIVLPNTVSAENSKLHAKETIINKKDADYIFSLTKPQWEVYAQEMVHPDGWEVQLSSHDTGTSVMSYDPKTGIGTSVQPLYMNENSPPDMLVIGSYFPLGTHSEFTDDLKHGIESEAKKDLGSEYKVSVNYTKKLPFKGIELLVTKVPIEWNWNS